MQSKHPHHRASGARVVYPWGTVGGSAERRSKPPALCPTLSVDFLSLPHVHVLSSKMLVPRFQYPHWLPHPHKVFGGTELVDVCKTLHLMHGPQKMSCIRSSGPWSRQAHRCFGLMAPRERLCLFLLCLMNMQVWENWQKGNGAYRNITNSLQ